MNGSFRCAELCFNEVHVSCYGLKLAVSIRLDSIRFDSDVTQQRFDPRLVYNSYNEHHLHCSANIVAYMIYMLESGIPDCYILLSHEWIN